jgi:hypothetical protein
MSYRGGSIGAGGKLRIDQALIGTSISACEKELDYEE